MWCPKCQADVAAEVMADNRSVRCATCGGEVSLSSSTRTSVKTREARELLERWANDHLLSHQESTPAPHEKFMERTFMPSASAMNTPSTADRRSSASPNLSDASLESAIPARHAPSSTIPGATSAPKARKFRIDQAHPTHSISTQNEPVADESPAAKAEQRISAVRERERAAPNPTPSRSAAAARIPAPHAAFDRPANRPSRRTDRAHASAPGPHFDVQSAMREQGRSRTNWTSIVGQLLAYLGVGLLTVGSSLVLWSYFGGPAKYAPTGWLVTTAGQMLLFLGVVTLVSGGMEQTTEEVKFRIESLGDKLLRFERASRDHALRGPHTAAEHYDNPDEYDESGDSDEYVSAPRERSRGQAR